MGNTRTRIGLFRGKELVESRAQPSSDAALVVAAALELPVRASGAPVVVASVNPPAGEAILDRLGGPVTARGGQVYRFGTDLEIPMPHALRDARTVGQDRLLNALGAFSRAQQACVVVDAGTAITVDFVDGTGVFQGGAIAPGLGLMLEAMHRGTAALPAVGFESVADDSPFGKDTAEAMRLGVQSAARGLVRHLVERYSEFYGAFPQVVATGGDAAALFDSDDLVEHVVPDLTLMGIQAACVRVLGEAEESDQNGEADLDDGRA